MKVVRFVFTDGSQTAEYTSALSEAGICIVDTLPCDPNVTLELTLDIDWPLKLAPPSGARDLLDLSVCIYIADEVASREAASDHWSRSFDLVVPVADPQAWAAATSTLQRALRTLSGDSFAFTWADRIELPPIGRHRAVLPNGYDAVCLFSGGIDSLLGAFQLLAEGKRVILVGHQADGFTAAAQKELYRALSGLFGKQVRFVQCRAARSLSKRPHYELPDKVEITHRPRSLLFLGLAVAVATSLGIEDIYLPENGLIALNVPLQKSRIGTLSTRTTHPLFLSQYLDCLAATGIYGGSIRNPFLYQSKTDMLGNVNPAIKPLLPKTISCSNVGRLVGKTGKLHCGHCVPCIYRRAAMVSAGMDNADDYADDLFQDLATATRHCQIDFRALVEFAHMVISASPAARDLMVLAHGFFPADIGARIGLSTANDYSPWSEMLLRWAQNFLQTANTLCSDSAKAIVGLPICRKVVNA